MSKPLEILEKLQRIDLEIGAALEEEKAYKRRLEALAEEIEKAEGELAGRHEEVETLKAALRDVEERIRKAGERIERDEARFNALRGEREIKALNKEINTASKTRRQAEREASDLRDKLTEKGVLRDAKELEIEKLKAETERVRAELEEKKTGWGAALERQKKEREDLVACLGQALLRRYEHIRSRRGGRAVVPLRDETCQGCYMRVPPQISIRLQRGEEEIISCPHCHRIIYVDKQGPPEAV